MLATSEILQSPANFILLRIWSEGRTANLDCPFLYPVLRNAKQAMLSQQCSEVLKVNFINPPYTYLHVLIVKIVGTLRTYMILSQLHPTILFYTHYVTLFSENS